MRAAGIHNLSLLQIANPQISVPFNRLLRQAGISLSKFLTPSTQAVTTSAGHRLSSLIESTTSPSEIHAIYSRGRLDSTWSFTL